MADRATVPPNIRRVYAYGQMLFALLVGIAATAGSVYAWLGTYATDTEVVELVERNNKDDVPKDKPLPHDKRFKKVEAEVKAVREALTEKDEVIALLTSTDKETLKLLVRRIASEAEPRRAMKMRRGREAEEKFEYHLRKGEEPIDALRMALRRGLPGR